MNWFSATTAIPVDKDNSKLLAITDFGSWVLGNFKNIAELKAAIASNQTAFWVPVAKDYSSNPFPMHYAIVDKSGANVVVEISNGKILLAL